MRVHKNKFKSGINRICDFPAASLAMGGRYVRSMVLASIERINRAAFTYHLRPMESKDIGTKSDSFMGRVNCGIVIQGPILRTNNFTLETVRLYRKHFPDSRIVVSTWNDQRDEDISAIECTGAEVLTQPKPKIHGPSNINLQIASSLSGIEALAVRGTEYVLKSRTDQRFYAPDVLRFLVTMSDVFPTSFPLQQNKRIIAASLDTFKYRMYGLSDQFVFGQIDDMLKYWSCPHDLREDFPITHNIGEHAKQRFGEVYLASEYLNRIGRDLEWTLADSWRVFADYFSIVDADSLDLYWNKYARHREHRSRKYDFTHSHNELTFRDWLMLYSSWDKKSAPEFVRNLKAGDPLVPPCRSENILASQT